MILYDFYKIKMFLIYESIQIDVYKMYSKEII